MLKNIKSFLAQAKLNKGFTLLEILLVVAAIAILAGIVIVALNPQKQLSDTRDADRQSAVNTILNAVYQYSIDNADIPAGIPVLAASGDDAACDTHTAANICQTDAASCGLTVVDLGVLTDNGTYLVSIPNDPQDTDPGGTGYNIVQDTNGRVTVCAPNAEGAGVTIEVTR